MKNGRKGVDLTMLLLIIIYIVASYQCLNYVWYSRRIYVISDTFGFYMKKLLIAIFFGWAIIPLALLMSIFKF